MKLTETETCEYCWSSPYDEARPHEEHDFLPSTEEIISSLGGVDDPLVWYLRLDDWGDPWGTTMSHAFGVCHALYYLGEEIPEEWEFKPGALSHLMVPMESWPEGDYVLAVQEGDITAADLRRLGYVLIRYGHDLKRAGLSY